MSDDDGKTWKRGTDVGIDATPGQQVWGGGEAQLVPFGGGDGLAMLIRARTLATEETATGELGSHAGDVGHNHALAFSHNGGMTWSNSTRMAIETVYCEGSLAVAGNGDLLVSSPSTANGVRADLTVWAAKRSHPSNFTKLLTLYSSSSAYSSMLCPDHDGHGGSSCLNLFERDGSTKISLARFSYP
jgi:hypothetical protein